MTITSHQLVETARSWIGTPYRHQGRTKGQHVDCIGLIVGVAEELGVQLVAEADYTESPSGTILMRRARERMTELDRKTPQYGDIMVLWGWNRNEPQHFAIMAEANGVPSMIHAFSKHKKVVEHAYDQFWTKRLVGLFRLYGQEID